MFDQLTQQDLQKFALAIVLVVTFIIVRAFRYRGDD